MTTEHQYASFMSSDMHVQRFRNGVSLTVPESHRPSSGLPLSHLFDSSVVTYFMDMDSRGVLVNEACAELNSASSVHDLINKNATNFYKTASALQHMAEDNQVMQTRSLVATGKAATKINGEIVDVINLKLPWYKGTDIIGILGLTLNVHPEKLSELSQNIASLLSSDLFTPYQISQLSRLAADDRSKVYFTPREQDVLMLLLRGMTAKQIGSVLSISKRTVENVIVRMREKTDCHSKYELMAKYMHLVR